MKKTFLFFASVFLFPLVSMAQIGPGNNLNCKLIFDDEEGPATSETFVKIKTKDNEVSLIRKNGDAVTYTVYDQMNIPADLDEGTGEMTSYSAKSGNLPAMQTPMIQMIDISLYTIAIKKPAGEAGNFKEMNGLLNAELNFYTVVDCK